MEGECPTLMFLEIEYFQISENLWKQSVALNIIDQKIIVNLPLWGKKRHHKKIADLISVTVITFVHYQSITLLYGWDYSDKSLVEWWRPWSRTKMAYSCIPSAEYMKRRSLYREPLTDMSVFFSGCKRKRGSEG